MSTQHSYKATLHGDRVEWNGEQPDLSNEPDGVAVEITIVDEVNNGVPASDGPAMAAALERLAAANSVRSIDDPIAWQREQRFERTLPDRD